MTALAKDRQSAIELWKKRIFTLAAGYKAFKNGACGLVVGTTTVRPMAAGVDLIHIGKFAETVDATAGALPVDVQFPDEMKLEWWENSATNAIAATDLLRLAYFEDDQTVGINPNTFKLAGRIWAVDASMGVLVERMLPEASRLPESPAVAFVANDLVIGNYPAQELAIDIPATGAASTVTLPAAAREGTRLNFVADGTKNGHTVQYRDATGPVNLTTALVASKRHQVTAIFLNGIWTANAYVSP